ncbi:hypothetical protein ColLi_08461 [Colletotrichum liriopes]|uniref:Uncharacterized protein n=1 Tax=Colletotrichum liriopes TaxID=708192 RepID=A0AA37GQZ5_9PEZI|nr:hypothetical protein ColLi_08461 [Colletotrichum liriopes]
MTKSGVSLANLAQLDVESPSENRTILEAVLLETIHVKPPLFALLSAAFVSHRPPPSPFWSIGYVMQGLLIGCGQR